MSSIDDPLPCAKKSQLCTQTKKMAMDTVFRDALDGFESTPHSETFKMLELEVNSQEKLEICVNLTLTKVSHSHETPKGCLSALFYIYI